MTTLLLASFIAGCWSVQDGTSTQTESWTKPTTTLMLGVAQRKNEQNQTESYEFLRIEQKSNGDVIYTPYINGVQGPDFKLDATHSFNRKASQKATFINDANDFPKRISYQKDASSPDMISIRLEGQDQNGKELVIEFPMFRSTCEI